MHKLRVTVVLLIVLVLTIAGFSLINMKDNKSRQLVKAIEEGKTEEAIDIIEKAELGELDMPAYNKITSRILVRLDAGAGTYPIIAASWKGNLKVVEALINKGVDVNAVSFELENTALIEALFSRADNRYKIALILIDNGAEVDHANIRGEKAIKFALMNDEWLLETQELKEGRTQVIISIVEHSKELKEEENYKKLIEELKCLKDTDVLSQLE